MGANLRTVLRSWRVWMTVGCVMYLWLGHRLEPVVAAWPGGLVVAFGLAMLALLIAGGMVMAYGLFPYVIDPWFTYLTFTGETAKAKEKFADSLMSISTAVRSATFISVLVFPLTLFIQTMVSGRDPLEALVSWWQITRGFLLRSTWWPGSHLTVFLILYLTPLIIGIRSRRRALVIYDTIALSTPVVAPTAQRTPKQPTVPDPGPPVYVKANEGSQRRWRHRTK